MTQRFETRQWIPFPVELVFAFFANPSNLPHIMPPRLKTRIEDIRLQPPPPRPTAADPARRFKSIAAGEGSEILISFCPISWLPQRVSWMARIVEFSWNSHFVDEQVRGPFAEFRQRHGISAEIQNGIEGTLVSDVVEYALPGGIFGKLGNPILARQLKSQFDYRHKRLPEILEAAARQATKHA
jgi:ligand-binding SRPBCC domain-containing protein